jgi:hypothetical protein
LKRKWTENNMDINERLDLIDEDVRLTALRNRRNQCSFLAKEVGSNKNYNNTEP